MLYIRYILENVEPLRITDDSTSQYGQMDTLTYIPGMTIRGVVIQTLAEELEQKLEKDRWEKLRQELFSNQVAFLNAYPMGGEEGKEEQELIPSPKGFYENKESLEEKKEIENLLLKGGELEGGLKRARLGRYCYMEDHTIFFSNVELGGDMRISRNTEKRKDMFRSQYIAKDQKFCGYIVVQNQKLGDVILSALNQEYLLLGNGRFAGMGKCKIVEKEFVPQLSYQQYNIKEEKKGICYLYLLSNMVMYNANGELTGMDIPTLEKQLGIENLEIKLCATSTVKNNGYNRIWNTKLPEMLMYEMGSVFQLYYQGVLKQERAAALLEEGIGIRKNEGFGRALILEGYENLKFKQKIEKKSIVASNLVEEELKKEDKQVLFIAAKGYYLEKLKQAGKSYLVDPKNRKNPILNRTLTSSQLGTIESYAASLQFIPQKAEKELLAYLEHAVAKDEAKRVHGQTQKRNIVKEWIELFLQSDLDQFLESDLKSKICIMGIEKKELLTKEEILRWKLQFLIELIRFVNREG